MEECVAKEVRALSSQFSRWHEIMRRYDKRLYHSGGEDVSDEEVTTMGEVLTIYDTILKICTRCGRFRETWDFPVKFSLTPYGHEIVVSSRKTGARFTLGRYHREIFLSSYLLAPTYIKKMDDEFWSCFVELQAIGNFSFQASGMPPSREAHETMKRFKNSKSSIFQVIRNYIFLEIYGGHVDDLGSLDVRWPVNLPWDELITRAAHAFRCLYKINYLLYKYGGPSPLPGDYMPASR
jgi:hypothetical protein